MADESTQETSTQAGTVDLDSPAVKAAIQAAATKAVKDAEARLAAKFDEDTKGLKKNRDEIKREKEKLQEELDAARTKAEAAEHGVDSSKLEELAEKRAQAKAELIRRQLADEIKESQEARTKATEESAALQTQLHRERVEKLLAREEGIIPDAFQDLADRVVKMVTFQHIDGQWVPFVHVNGETWPGNVSDLLAQARQGKGPLTRATHMFSSNGKGSGTTSTNGAGAGSKNIHKMTAVERAAYTREHGIEKFKEELANTPFPEVVTQQNRR